MGHLATGDDDEDDGEDDDGDDEEEEDGVGSGAAAAAAAAEAAKLAAALLHATAGFTVAAPRGQPGGRERGVRADRLGWREGALGRRGVSG